MKILLKSVQFVLLIIASHTCQGNDDCPSPKRNTTTTCEGIVCYHGDCQFISPYFSKCLCDPGWDGPLCNDCCSLTCPEGHRCQLVLDLILLKYVPICLKTWPPQQDPQLTSPIMPNVEQPTANGDFSTVVQDNVESTLTETPDTTETESKHQCHSVPRENASKCQYVNCYNGDCVSTGTITIPGMSGNIDTSICQCDEGWIGSFCDICCDLQCNNGSCGVDYYDRMRCHCHIGYMGEFCEELEPTEAPVTKNVTISKLMSLILFCFSHVK